MLFYMYLFMLPERNVKVSWKDLYGYDQAGILLFYLFTNFWVNTLIDLCSNPKVFTFFLRLLLAWILSALDISTC